jgi:Ca2+-binding RTX toxin-like protein
MGAGTTSTLTYTSGDSAPYANTLAILLSNGLENGTLTALPYSSGSVAPGAPGGLVIFGNAPTTLVTIPTQDVGTVIEAGPTSITGGAAGETVVAGSGGLTYINITPSGSAIDYIVAGDGANVITTSTTGTGNYQVNTGAGSDTISVFGNGVINAGSGNNSISVSGGSSFIYSEGNDDINANGSGTDTVSIGTGQATINPGSANFFITEDGNSAKQLFLAPGTGSDTVSVSGGGTVYGGSAGNNLLIAGASNGAKTMLIGGGNGDQLYATGDAPVVLSAGSGNETLSGAGGTVNGVTVSGSTADDTFRAGSGNDTIVGGTGNDLVMAGTGNGVITLGTGNNTFAVVDGEAGGRDTITDFSSEDRLDFIGYGLAQVPTGSVGGSTFIDLPDGTEIILQGVPAVSASQISFDAPLCFLQGTLIGTIRGGEVIEHLAIGDFVSTTTGGEQPIRWIGICTVSTRFADPLRVMPIRIRAGALAENIPERDLLVSPDHAMLVDGVLIQAAALVNGISIAQERSMPETFTYYHIELSEHSLVLAEGAPAETFVDNVDRMAFDNWAEHQALYGFDIPIMEMDLPRASSRRQVPAGISNRLMRRAAELFETMTEVAA